VGLDVTFSVNTYDLQYLKPGNPNRLPRHPPTLFNTTMRGPTQGSFVSTMHINPKFLESSAAAHPRPVAPLPQAFEKLALPATRDIPRARSSPPKTLTTIAPSITARTDYSRRADVPSTLLRHASGMQRPRIASKASIPHLREALSSLDSKMASLMSQREELESHLEQAVRLQSPIQRLPCEILASVFIKGVFGADDENPLMVSTLMLVCRYWADVAINTPALWSNIAVSTHDSLEKARRKLQRSKSCPLDITINFSPRQEHSAGVTESVIHAMDLIRPALWRTKSFRLSVPNRPQAHAALLRCREDAPLLEFLSIRIFHSMQEDHYSSPALPLFNGHTPRLRSCSFTSFNFAWDVQLVSRLRVLKLGGYWNGSSPSVFTLLHILSECPELEEFALRNLSDAEPDTCDGDQGRNPARTIHFPRLLKASFYYAGVARTHTILNQMSFPGLQTLELCYLDDLTPILERLKQQSLTSFPLRSLRIESCFFNELKFVGLLSRLHSLVSLELVDCEDVSSHFLKVIQFLYRHLTCLPDANCSVLSRVSPHLPQVQLWSAPSLKLLA
jgi:hypothetical protein